MGNNTDTYVWEVSTNGGGSFITVSDGPEYSGANTATLTVITPGLEKNGYIYRVFLSNSTTSCAEVTSNQVLLNTFVGTVITNRRITIRVNRN